MNKYIITALIGITLSAGGLFYTSTTENRSLYIAEQGGATNSSLYTTPSTSATTSNAQITDVRHPLSQTANEGEAAAVQSSAAQANRASTSAQTPTPAEQPVEAPSGIAVTLQAGGVSYTAHVPDGATVIDAMNAASEQGLTYSGKQFMGLGLRVDVINGIRSDNGNYWFLYVNGRTSDLGASDMTLKQGDEVEWRYKQSY